MEECAGVIPPPQPKPISVPQLAKTKLCKFFSSGTCKRGVECSFAHTYDELQQKPDLVRTSLCQTYLRTGTCDQPYCTYAHGKQELRSTADFFKMKICRFARDGTCQKGSACRFAHPAAKRLSIKEEEGSDDALTDEAELASARSSPNSAWLGVRERSARRSWAEESEDTCPTFDGDSTADNSSPSPRRSTFGLAANIPEDATPTTTKAPPRSKGGRPQHEQRQKQQQPRQKQQHQQQPPARQQAPPPGQHEPRQQRRQLQQPQQLQLQLPQQPPPPPHPPLPPQSPHLQQQQYLQQRQQHQPVQPQQFPGYQLDVPGRYAVIPPGTTTVMLVNLPKFLTQAAVMDLLEEKNLHISARFDFFYCPWDLSLGTNMGYAIINLDSHEAAAQFVRRWDGQAFFEGAPPFRMLPAPDQGVLANLQQFSGSPVARQADPRKRPLVRRSPAEPLKPLEIDGWRGQVPPQAPCAQVVALHGAHWGPCCTQPQLQQRQACGPVPGLATLPQQPPAISGFLPM